MAKILLTGGCGFMGRWVAKSFIEKGHRLWILDNLSNSTPENIAEFGTKIADFRAGDIKDREVLEELFKNKFDLCVHLAASINVQQSIDSPQACFANNVTGTFNVLEECRKAKVKFVFISSALVYQTAKAGELISEEHPLNPSCPYTASKIFGEQWVFAYYKTYGLPVVVLRPFSIYGPWQRSDSEGGVMSVFIERVQRNEPLKVFGSGEQVRDFFYVEDCAEYIYQAAFSPAAVGGVFNAASGFEVKIKDLAKKIASGRVEVSFVEHHHPHAEIMHMAADSSRARNILGWQPKVDLEEGIRRTREWLSALSMPGSRHCEPRRGEAIQKPRLLRRASPSSQ